MAVAKRQGREKPAKIEQRKVKGRSKDRSENFRQNHSWLSPICIGQAQEEGKKTYKKRSQRALSLSLPLSPSLSPSLFLSPPLSPSLLSLPLSPSPACWGALLFVSLGQHAFTPRRWIFLLLSKQNRVVTRSCNTDLAMSYNTVRSRPESYNTVYPRPESCDTQRGALMSVTPDLCCDETEQKSIHLPDKPIKLHNNIIKMIFYEGRN